MKPTGRKPWPYSKHARAFHIASGRNPYTMVPNATLEIEMMDSQLSKEDRVLAAVRRFAWGNLSKVVVDAMPKIKETDPTPRPITQKQLGEILGLSPSMISEACARLKDQGWLSKSSAFLKPENRISPTESPDPTNEDSDSKKPDSPFLRNRQRFLEENPEVAKSLSEHQEIFKQSKTFIQNTERRILAYHRDLERRKTQQNQQQAPDKETDADQRRLCAYAQNGTPEDREQKENFFSANLTDVNSKLQASQFETPKIESPHARIDTPVNPPESNAPPEASLKPFKVLKENRKHEETTTTEAPVIPSSPSSIVSAPLPKEWRDGLASVFTRAHKPAPLPAQSLAAYLEVGEDWKSFLEWLPGAPQFKRTQHPGGLPTLIQFFNADRQQAPAVADPETLTKEEIENYWKSRFEQNPAERKDIASMFPEIFKMEVA